MTFKFASRIFATAVLSILIAPAAVAKGSSGSSSKSSGGDSSSKSGGSSGGSKSGSSAGGSSLSKERSSGGYSRPHSDSDIPQSIYSSSSDGDDCGDGSTYSYKGRSGSGGCVSNEEAQEAQMYELYKGKSWDQLSSQQQNHMASLGVENAAVYEDWKQERKDVETYNKAVQQQPMYDKVKGRSWDQLSSQEQAYAAKNGIRNADEFNTWKETHELIMNAKKQKDELAAFNKIKYKSWGELSATEKADMRRKGVANEMAFEAYKDEGQKKLIASRMSEEEKAAQAKADEDAKKEARLAEMAAQRAQQNNSEMIANQETVPSTLSTRDVSTTLTAEPKEKKIASAPARTPASKPKKQVSFTRSRVAN